MNATARTHQWRGPKLGATLEELMAGGSSYYPIDEVEGPDEERFTASLPREMRADLELVSELWNELDKALGIKRPKWKPTSNTLERLVGKSLTGVWDELGGRPQSQADREAFIKAAIERIRSRKKK
jgi:hypothetical protein